MNNQPQNKANPGSQEAQDQGCTCPVMDNNYGKGVGNPPQFWMNGDCPLHGLSPSTIDKEK